MAQLNLDLHPQQAKVFQSEAQEILYGGAAGGGKSYLMRAAAIIWAMQIPGLQVYLFRRQFPDLEKNHLQGPTSFPMLLGEAIDSGEVRWNRSKYFFEFANGSRITLCHCQKDDDRYNYLGAEMHVLLFDELSQFTPVVYNFLRTRVRMVGIEIPEGVVGSFPKILAGSNPGGPFHQSMKHMFIDPSPPYEYHRAPQDEGGMLRQFIPAKISDNPALLAQDPTYAQRLMGLGDPQLVKAYLEGDFNVVLGGMFDDLWRPSVHVLKPFAIPKSWYLDRSFDWGSSKPFSIGFWAESDGTPARTADGKEIFFPRGSLIQFGEWYGWTGKPDEGVFMTATEIAKGIKDIESGINRKVSPGPADSMIYSSQNDNCVADDMEKEGVHWHKVEKGPGSRAMGIEKIRNMLHAARYNPLELPGLYFFENCRNSIRVLPVAPRDHTKFDDIAKGYEDHPIDMISYRVRQQSNKAGYIRQLPF